MFKEVTSCRACGSDKLTEILDLGRQPLANSYHKEDELLYEYPLVLNVCDDCFHGQLSLVVHPDKLFKHYLYVSGTTKTLRDYFDWFAEYANTRYGIKYNALNVLDIACNDGSQLDSFKKLGYKTFGVDPAENLVPLAREKGHTVTLGYWGSYPNDQWFENKMDIITAQNVFAHTDDIYDFLINCSTNMHDGSVLLIQTSQANMFKRNEFDTIYHEHLSFFNTKSMNAIANRAGLVLNRVDKTDIHGTSYVFELRKWPTDDNNVAEVLLQEESDGLYDMKTYERFAINAYKCVKSLQIYVKEAISDRRVVVGYGAAAKGMTLLNYGNIKLDYIVDDNSMKHGLLTPGMNIPIFSPEALRWQDESIVFIPLAWNFFDEIRAKIKLLRHNKSDTFVKYFPTLEVTV